MGTRTPLDSRASARRHHRFRRDGCATAGRGIMSGDFLWELEKLRRRFGLDAEELRSAVRELTRKQRGIKQQERTGEITRARKNRIAARQIKYWGTIEELADLVGDSLKGK